MRAAIAALALVLTAACSGDDGPSDPDPADQGGDGFVLGDGDGEVTSDGDGAGDPTTGDGDATSGDEDPGDTVAAVLPDRCNLQFPEIVTAADLGGVVTYYGRVEEVGLTDTSDGASVLRGELMVGPLGADPTQQPQSFTTTAATWNDAVTGQSYEEFEVDLVASTAGELSVFFRFSVDAGVSWRVCDVDGFAAHAGAADFDARAASVLRVYATQSKPNLPDYCRVWQSEWTSSVSAPAPVVTVEVYEPGVTTGGSPATVAEVGLGPLGANPAVPGAFSWSSALPYKGEGPSAAQNDEYEGALFTSAPPTGTYQVVVRVRRDDDPVFTFCDTNPDTMDFLHTSTARLTLTP